LRVAPPMAATLGNLNAALPFVFQSVHWERRLSSRPWERRLSSRLVFGTAQCRAKDVGSRKTLQTQAKSIRADYAGENVPSRSGRKIA
jgi:hypothetical protein